MDSDEISQLETEVGSRFLVIEWTEDGDIEWDDDRFGPHEVLWIAETLSASALATLEDDDA